MTLTRCNQHRMNDYELEQCCDAHPDCDCNCMVCPAFAEHHFSELGYYDE